ncbi:MAG: ribonuclease R [Proteobacteria bacterium]|nr:ribonuclease R [Pseudomonadota bacterium]
MKMGRRQSKRHTSHGRPGRRERKGQREGPAVRGKTSVGELRLHRDGYGFVVPADGGEDLFIPARFIGDALHTDLVEAAAVGGRGGKREGRITRIVERRVKRMVGRLSRHGNAFEVAADDRKVRHRVVVRPEDLSGAGQGANVVVLIKKYPRGDEPMEGAVERVLGSRGDMATETDAVTVRHQLTREFHPSVLREAERVCAFDAQAEMNLREDLRGVPFVTIDGETAKDFDDAVAVRRLAGGDFELLVSIADVSRFVEPGTALDWAAYERGTSVYFPGDCIPMLPEALSNGACSLRPGEDRLTFTAELTIGRGGRVLGSRFYRSVIKSRARLTYTQVKRALIDEDPAVVGELGDLAQELGLMRRCFERLRASRLARGSIDFDLPEPEIQIDMQGGIEDIVRAERHTGHMLIEEFMIAANEAVAEFLSESGAGCIYRVHEPPPSDKLAEFAVLLHNLGFGERLAPGASPGRLSRVVAWARGKPFERMVNHMLLRSMSQAVYSGENVGHYGLASKCYCHFTSPIRRYPDLVVHRLLAAALQTHSAPSSKLKGQRGSSFGLSPLSFEQKAVKSHASGLGEIAAHCSRRERIAMEAEREMAKLYAALFMQERVGMQFDGIISHVAKFGFFVELIDYFVEGMVHSGTLGDDTYLFDERACAMVGRRKKRAFRVGDKVRIEVAEVDIPNREILFELV